MKSVRPLVITLGLVVCVLVSAVVLALTPSVQRWAVRRALAQQPGAAVQFTDLAAGFSSAHVAGLQFEQDGLRVQVGRAEVNYSLWRYLTGDTLHLRRVQASDVVVDASKLSPGETRAGAAGAPAAAPGAITQLRLPFALIVDDLAVTGRALLPGRVAGAAVPADFELRGGGIAPEQEGRVQLKMTVSDPSPGARVTALRTQGELKVRQTSARTFDRAQFDVVIDADGPGFAQQNQLKLAATLNAAGQAADYSLTIDTLHYGQSEQIVRVNARQADAAAPFAGDWQLQVRTAQVEPFSLGGPLPRFALNGTGRFLFDPGTSAAAVQGTLRGDVSGLEAIEPALRPIGAVQLESEFDIADAAGVTRIANLRLQLDGARRIFSAETRHAVAFDRRTRQLQFNGTSLGEVGRVRLDGLPLEWVRPFVREIDVSGGAVSGEFVLAADEGQLRLRSTAPLRVDALTLVRDGEMLVERAELSAGLNVSLAPPVARVEVQEFSLRTPAGDSLGGSLAVEYPFVAGGEAALRARVQADLPRLLALAGVGHVRIDGDIDLVATPERATVRSFRGTLADGAGRTLLNVTGARAFAFDLARGQLVDTGADEIVLAEISTGRTALAELPVAALRERWSGEATASKFTLTAKGERLFLRATEPVRLTGFTWRQDRRAVVENVSLESAPEFEFAGVQDWKVAAASTQLRSASNAVLATLQLEASASTAEGLRANASFNADLAALATQPALASLRALMSGRASGELRAARTKDGVQVEARATLNNLVAREANQALPIANLSARVLLTPEGRLTLDVPLLLDRSGHRSDLRLSAEAHRRSESVVFDATLTGQHLELADALGLWALAGGADTSSTTTSAAPSRNGTGANARTTARPDAAPVWQGLQGQLALDVQSITRGADWNLSGLSARVLIEPEGVQLVQLDGAINEKGRVGATAQLRFTPGAQPYALAGDFTLTEFDLGALLKALEPDKPATIEGVFAVNGKFNGNGDTVEQTFERTRGQFQLASRQGVFRGLRRASEKLSVASKAVELGAAIGSIFGSSKVKEAAEKVAGQTYQVDQLAQALAELPFDQLIVQLDRDESLNIRLEQFSLLSPEVRLTGRGTITHVEGRSILQQPLNLTASLAARGKIEQQLAKLRVLDGTKDELGYAKAREAVTIGGTLSVPNPTPFFLKLAESKLGDFFGPGN